MSAPGCNWGLSTLTGQNLILHFLPCVTPVLGQSLPVSTVSRSNPGLSKHPRSLYAHSCSIFSEQLSPVWESALWHHLAPSLPEFWPLSLQVTGLCLGCPLSPMVRKMSGVRKLEWFAVITVETSEKNWESRARWKDGLSSVSCCWQSFSSTIFSLFQSVTLLACSLDARPCMPVVVMYYCTFQDTIL